MVGRSYDTNVAKYKFTGKERDKESSYDYFGARYYDARIGRWGGVEPLMEKYFSLSPYVYALDNPIKVFDIDGRDAIGEVDEENKTITITVNIIYFLSSRYNHQHALSPEKLNRLFSYVEEAMENWNNVSNIEYNGENYQVNFVINLIEFKGLQKEINDLLNNNIGANVAVDRDFLNNRKDVPAAVHGGNILALYNPEGGTFTGSHELGHLMGIDHPALTEDKIFKNQLIDVMSNSAKKVGPRDWNVRQIIDKLDFK